MLIGVVMIIAGVLLALKATGALDNLGALSGGRKMPEPVKAPPMNDGIPLRRYSESYDGPNGSYSVSKECAGVARVASASVHALGLHGTTSPRSCRFLVTGRAPA